MHFAVTVPGNLHTDFGRNSNGGKVTCERMPEAVKAQLRDLAAFLVFLAGVGSLRVNPRKW